MRPWWHGHEYQMRERGDDGALYLVCACGRRVPFPPRDDRERARVLSGRDFQLPNVKKGRDGRL